jgi:hypothetical protein
MSYKKEGLISSISNNLAFSSKSTALKNVIGLFDSNRVAQDFFVGLLSLIFGYKDLKELDKLNDITNYPAIDLGSEQNRVAFQITTQNDSAKIKDTIAKFIKHKLYGKYDRLVVFIIGEKKGYITTFETQGKFTFDKERDIWDDNFLIKEIDKLDIATLTKVKDFLEEHLWEFKSPNTISFDDIRSSIEILKRDFGSIKEIESQLNIPNRDDDFIKNIKNPANNISWECFKAKILGHLKYGDIIDDFLRNPINKNIQSDYYAVCGAIQKFYKDPKNDYASFEGVFENIFNKVNLLYNDDMTDKNKVLILLHNMYFNCDIGKNSL